METSTENRTEKSLEKVLEKKPVSVYSVNFAEIINDAEREFLIERATAKKPEKKVVQSRFSKAVFNWRNGIAVAAILAVGILHFAFQLSFIQLEYSQNQPAGEVAPKIEQLLEQPVDNKPVEFESKKSDVVVPEKANAVMPEKAAPQVVRQRSVEPVPSKPSVKKKEAVDSRAERLRRAERILTGI
jgi:hypothetical protein